jgi:hypothetical protein
MARCKLLGFRFFLPELAVGRGREHRDLLPRPGFANRRKIHHSLDTRRDSWPPERTFPRRAEY